jgi:hypothetical protein
MAVFGEPSERGLAFRRQALFSQSADEPDPSAAETDYIAALVRFLSRHSVNGH